MNLAEETVNELNAFYSSGRNWNWRRIGSVRNVVLLCSMLVLAGCGNMIKGKGLATKKVAEFHTQLNDEKYKAIYDDAAAEFRTATTAAKWDQLLGAIHRKLGRVTGTQTRGWNVNSVNFKTTAVLTQQTTFEHGTATETFTFLIRDNDAVLLGYNINSTDLIVN